MDDAIAWAVEERLWLEGAAAYEVHLDPACLMAFPGVGVMTAAEVLAALPGARRWLSVAMTGRRFGRAGPVVVLAYEAEAVREGGEAYRCACTSTYRTDLDRPKLVQHQQTLVG